MELNRFSDVWATWFDTEKLEKNTIFVAPSICIIFHGSECESLLSERRSDTIAQFKITALFHYVLISADYRNDPDCK